MLIDFWHVVANSLSVGSRQLLVEVYFTLVQCESVFHDLLQIVSDCLVVCQELPAILT